MSLITRYKLINFKIQVLISFNMIKTDSRSYSLSCYLPVANCHKSLCHEMNYFLNGNKIIFLELCNPLITQTIRRNIFREDIRECRIKLMFGNFPVQKKFINL